MSICTTVCTRFTNGLESLSGVVSTIAWRETAVQVGTAAASGSFVFWCGTPLLGASAVSALTVYGIRRLQQPFRTEDQAQDLITIYNKLPFRDKPEFEEGSVFSQAKAIAAWMKANKEKLPKYQSLYFENLGIRNLPPELIEWFPSLERLDLSHNQLQSLPDEIGNLASLESLQLSHNQLRSLPDSISNCKALDWLFLDHNQLRSLPDSIGNCKTLHYLSLDHNQLQSLPDSIGNCQALHNLSLNCNQLQSLPDSISNCQALHNLSLHYNQLQSLPDSIGNCKALRQLSLSHNQLLLLPDSIGNLSFLQELSLCSNRLFNLPSSLGNCRYLLKLELSDNRLSLLPGSLRCLRSICKITAERNRFDPPYVQEFLTWLTLHRNEHPGQGPIFQLSIYDEAARARADTRTLPEELESWSAEFQEAYPRVKTGRDSNISTLLEALSAPEAAKLHEYLKKIRLVKDYENGGNARKNVVRRVDQMVQLACKTPRYRVALLNLIQEGTESCGDRVLLILNDIEILTQMHTQETNDIKFRELAIRASRYEQLKQHALQVAKKKGLGDTIETVLYYHLELRETLDLPISTKWMLYPDMSGVTEEMLAEAVAKIRSYSELDLLAASDYWILRMEQKCPESTKRINDEYNELLERAQQHDYQRPLPKDLKIGTSFSRITNYIEAAAHINQMRRRALAELGLPLAAAGVG